MSTLKAVDLPSLTEALSHPRRNKRDLEVLVKFLNGLPDFQAWVNDMTEAAKIKCCRAMKMTEAKEGAVLFNEGDKPDKFYIVLHGEIT